MNPMVLEGEGEGTGPWGLNSETMNLAGKTRGYASMVLFFQPPSKCVFPSVSGCGLVSIPHPGEWALLYSFSLHLTPV